eukprot:scaffold34877_cov115-Phaeocystis_antarctica.AAC.1
MCDTVEPGNDVREAVVGRRAMREVGVHLGAPPLVGDTGAIVERGRVGAHPRYRCSLLGGDAFCPFERTLHRRSVALERPAATFPGCRPRDGPLPKIDQQCLANAPGPLRAVELPADLAPASKLVTIAAVMWHCVAY